MSSSLDDMPPYEFFQHDLEEAVQKFLDLKADTDDIPRSPEVLRLNLFIEYISFHKNLESKEQLLQIDTLLSDFVSHLRTNSIDLSPPAKTLILEFVAYFLNYKS
jgi:hypothetical protein